MLIDLFFLFLLYLAHMLIISFCGQLLYSGKFFRVQIFAKWLERPSEEIFTVVIFAFQWQETTLTTFFDMNTGGLETLATFPCARGMSNS